MCNFLHSYNHKSAYKNILTIKTKKKTKLNDKQYQIHQHTIFVKHIVYTSDCLSLSINNNLIISGPLLLTNNNRFNDSLSIPW